ncbi:hypothetical protein OIV83_000019 [Microbotryomycetes sp. JL201]|nr:hypothetical protein OIV83_000019 [Microbotryomycetes sp. JL201]
MDPILTDIQHTKESFLTGLSSGRLVEFVPEWNLLEQTIRSHQGAGTLSAAAAQEVAAFAQVVMSITSALARVHGDIENILHSADQRAEALVQAGGMRSGPGEQAKTTRHCALFLPGHCPPMKEQREPTATQDTSIPEEDPRLQPYKQWFLDNFYYPYIDKETRKALLKLVPHHSPQQATTWFINARRRSGWSDLFRQHGNSSKDVFRHVLELADSEANKWQLDEGVRDKIQQVRAWFGRRAEGIVRNTIQSVVDRADKIVEETQREAELKRREREKHKLGLGRPARSRAQTSVPVVRPMVDHCNDIHSNDFFAGLLTTGQRNVSDGSSNDSYRDYSGVSRFSIDTDSTGLSSAGTASPISHESGDFALPPRRWENGDIVITPVTPQHPKTTQTQCYTTLADWAMAQTTLA